MNTHSAAGRLLVGLALVVLLAGCAAGATPSVTKTRDVAYESANSVLVPGELDVYAPVKAGSWPVVVMFHGAPGSSPKTDRSYLGEHARRVADNGFVVFNASWGQGNVVTLDVMPDSAHDNLGAAGWKVFLAAFPKAAAQD